MTLRSAILAVALLLLAVVAFVAAVEPGFWPFAVGVLLIVAALLFERTRYRQGGQGPMDGMAPTAERFIDPETGRSMRVWSNPAGERRYVEE